MIIYIEAIPIIKMYLEQIVQLFGDFFKLMFFTKINMHCYNFDGISYALLNLA